MSYTDNSQSTRTKQLAGRELFMFQTLNPHARQGGQEGFSHEQIVMKNSGSLVSGSAVASLRPARTAIPPSPPTISKIGVGNALAAVYFNAPTYVGSSPITSYTVTSNPGGITATGLSSPLVVTGLTLGKSYTFSIVAKNSDGTSAPSAPSAAITAATTPAAPTAVYVVVGNSSAKVYFTPPTNTGGLPIISYLAGINGGISISGTTSPITINGLTNGATYTFFVVARNAIGFSPEVRLAPVTILAAPGPPTAVSAYPENGKATVSFTAPTNNGGSPIIDYTVTSNPGVFTTTGTASPLIVYGLTNGTPYSFSVVARNAVGTSAAGVSSIVTTLTEPAPPTLVSATLGATDGTVIVSFYPPANNGGSPIIDYTVTSNPGGFTATGTTNSLLLSGLTIGIPYSFRVVARNRIGTSGPAYSNVVTPASFPPPPISIYAYPGYRSATIYFTAPTNNSGAPITSYTVTSTVGGFTATGTASPITVTGLTGATTYAFRIVATNSRGNSGIAYTDPVAPTDVPGAPTAVYANPRDGSALVIFNSPTNTGGLSLTSYTVTSNPGGITASGPATPITVTGLTNGTPYTFSVVAINNNGPSIPSLPSSAITPVPAPSAPTAVSAVAGNESATVSFTAPANIANALKTEYTVVSSPGNKSAVGAASPITVTGLTNGVAYTFNVFAFNNSGSSVSPPSNEIIPAPPIDQITASLTTSLGAYQAAATDAWVKITADEYAALQTNVTNTTKAGITDELINYPGAEDARTNYLTTGTSLLVANGIRTGTPAIPANNYLYAFAIMWVNTEPTEGMRVYTNMNKPLYYGYNQVGGILPATTSSGMSYYVRKGVATTNGDTEGILACFSGTSIKSGEYIGIKLLGNTDYAPTPSISYKVFNGTDVPAPNTAFTQSMAGIGNVVLQGLATPNKQWN